MRTSLKKYALAWACYVLLGGLAGAAVAWTLGYTGAGVVSHPTIRLFEFDGLHLAVLVQHSWASREIVVSAFDSPPSAEWLYASMAIDGPPVRAQSVAPGAIPSEVLSMIEGHRNVLAAATPFSRPAIYWFSTGWPARCMRSDAFNTAAPPPTPTPKGVLSIDGSPWIPYLPVWPGLTLNALFYSPLFFGLHRAWRWWVRHLRRSNGLCTHCAYNRKGLVDTATCPECGHTPRPMAAPAP